MPRTPKPEITAMRVAVAENRKVQITPKGLRIEKDISLEEWERLGDNIFRVQKSIQWMLGDWLVYGENKFQKRASERYEEAIIKSGLDRQTLKNYAYAARHIPPSLRKDSLGFHHHLCVAKLKSDYEKKRWLETAARQKRRGKPISLRLFRRSIECGRLITEKTFKPKDRGWRELMYYKWILALKIWWLRAKRKGTLKNFSEEQLQYMLNELRFLVDLVSELNKELRIRRGLELDEDEPIKHRKY